MILMIFLILRTGRINDTMANKFFLYSRQREVIQGVISQTTGEIMASCIPF